MSDNLLVMTTLPDHSSAEALAGELVATKLAACVNILPAMTSIYQWKGKSERGTEHLLLIKTRQQKYAALEDTIKKQHPYELPEILAFSITGGLPAYLAWINENTT